MTAVTEKGDIYPCHRYAGEEEYRIGTLKEGIDMEKLQRYYEQILSGFDEHCAGCWARHLCGGQCPWYLSRPTGFVGHPDKASCDRIREGAEISLWAYAAILEKRGIEVFNDKGRAEERAARD
jgi:uncharacterized protein